MTDRIPGAPGQYKATVTQEAFEKLQIGEEFSITITRDDQPIVEGTPYSKAAVLPDELAAQVCPGVEDPTPADALRALHEKIYPVGSVYISVLDTDPAELFGGTWQRLQNRFLLGAGGAYAGGTTGGEAEHKLTETELPTHRHHDVWDEHGSIQLGVTYGAVDNTSGNCYTLKNLKSQSGTDLMTGNTGANQPHNNMPPYLAVYMWKRTA